MRMPLVEDDPGLGTNLKKGLEKHHYAVNLLWVSIGASSQARCPPGGRHPGVLAARR